MTRSVITTNSFSSVGAGQQATLELAVKDLVYHRLLLLCSTTTAGGPTRANMEAHITQIRIKIKDKVQRVFSAAQLFAMNEVNGIVVADGFLPIFFSEPWRRTLEGEEILAWGTQDIDDLFVEVDIVAGALTPTLSARAIIDRARRPLGNIKKIRRRTVGVSSIGLRQLTNLPKDNGIYRLHAFSSVINSIKVEIDQRNEWDLDDAQARELYTEEGLAVPAALTSVIFDHTQRWTDFARLSRNINGKAEEVGEFKVEFDMSAATDFTLLSEVFGPRD